MRQRIKNTCAGAGVGTVKFQNYHTCTSGYGMYTNGRLYRGKKSPISKVSFFSWCDIVFWPFSW